MLLNLIIWRLADRSLTRQYSLKFGDQQRYRQRMAPLWYTEANFDTCRSDVKSPERAVESVWHPCKYPTVKMYAASAVDRRYDSLQSMLSRRKTESIIPCCLVHLKSHIFSVCVRDVVSLCLI